VEISIQRIGVNRNFSYFLLESIAVASMHDAPGFRAFDATSSGREGNVRRDSRSSFILAGPHTIIHSPRRIRSPPDVPIDRIGVRRCDLGRGTTSFMGKVPKRKDRWHDRLS
jgi:hypothetical protein